MYQKSKTVKSLMQEAYLNLLTEKPYLDVTVTDIVKTAGVARVSFYRTFSSIDKLLDSILDEFHDNVTDEVLPDILKNPEKAWKTLLVKTYYELKDDKFSLLNVLPENIEYLHSSIMKKFDFLSTSKNYSIEQKYLPALNLNTMFTCAKIWASHGYKETPEELADFAYKIIKHNFSLLK